MLMNDWVKAEKREQEMELDEGEENDYYDTTSGSNDNDEYVSRACGRADNDKLSQSDVRKRSIDAIDFSGRRVTIGDVVSKDSLRLNQAQKVLQALMKVCQVFFLDEISTGLDSLTTHQIITYLRLTTHALDCTTLVSLLQPDPETYEMFDDIIVFSEGQIVYQGPREAAVEFFSTMGFKCPSRKNVADFLQEVLSEKDQEQYWFFDDRYSHVPASKFVEGFQSFHVGDFLKHELSIPYDKNYSHPAALSNKSYAPFNYFDHDECVFPDDNAHTLDDGGIYLGALYFAIMLSAVFVVLHFAPDVNRSFPCDGVIGAKYGNGQVCLTPLCARVQSLMRTNVCGDSGSGVGGVEFVWVVLG
ncbi:pleiotropic drug resistance protein 6 [Phtheirospermum japonicum]|uniref:Pleiotropic drug resistance protein 6 n=1 Tax=Phtheirospermum japonicum TaxID=374723 RepID=A0A830C469_9LAMI|nr:pleiotropic drug resistance protein 6 [Phtheirospermum japonicum]